MAVSKAQVKAVTKYIKKAYDSILIRVKKDSKYNGDFIKTYADSRGESVNGFIVRAIEETIARDLKRDFIKTYAESRGENVNDFIVRAVQEAVAHDSKRDGSSG